MTTAYHKSITPAQNHPIQGWEVADGAAKHAIVPVATDVGKIARQLDDDSMWILTDHSPVTWKRLDVPAKDYVVYVNSTAGSDTYDGLTPATAWQTIDKAIDNAPAMWTGKCRIYATGTFTYTKRSLVSGIPVGRLAEPFVIVGEMADSGVGTVTCAAGSTTTVFNVSTTLVNDAHYGARLRFLTGANADKTVGIVANTTNTVSVIASSFSTVIAPAPGDTFVIERPGTVISVASSSGSHILFMSNGVTPRLISTQNISMGFYGIKWIFGGSTWMLINGGNTSVCFDSNEVVLGTAASNSKICVEYGAGVSTRILSFLHGENDGDSNVPFIGNSQMAHLFIKGSYPTSPSCALYTQHLGRLEYYTNVITDKASVHLCYQDGVPMALHIRGGSIYLTESALLYAYDKIAIDGQGLTTVGISIERNCGFYSSSTVSVSNVNGDAVSLKGSLSLLSTLSGTGNTGYGIRLGAGAIATVVSSTITGSSGDMIIGDTVATHAQLTSAGFITNANYLSRIARTQ